MDAESAEFSIDLLKWYDVHHRVLPWRVTSVEGTPTYPDPYHVLVSELMLQQTQVATVIPYFHRFLERFPTIESLAGAPEQDVLRLWQGLGYYSRARNLQKTARKVVTDFGGRLPRSVNQLLTLPGVGKYTAGAIASLAFGVSAPILDGNVARVLCRLDKIQTDPRDRATQDLLWARAAQILPTRRVGDFNSALMELGATLCTPRNPQCLICPVRRYCTARHAGLQDQIPLPRKSRPTPLIERWVVCVGSSTAPARWLIEQRPPTGRWAGMWQFLTFEPTSHAPDDTHVQSLLPLKVKSIQPVGQISHALTHRRYRFTVFRATTRAMPDVTTPDRLRTWVDLTELDKHPLPRPHVLIAKLLAG